MERPAHEFDNVTIYTHQMFARDVMGYVHPKVGYSRIEAKRVEVWIGRHAQYAKAVKIQFIPRGKRKMDHLTEGETSSVILDGWDHPEVPHRIGEGPQPLGDKKWDAEFAEFIDAYRLTPRVKVLLDLRQHDMEEKHFSTLSVPTDCEPTSPALVAESEIAAIEGRRRVQQHLTRERDRAIVDAKRRNVLDSTGKLECEACGFDFMRFYGIEFCEVHHLRPLSEADGEVETKLQDLAVVCSNCHRVIHRGSPFYTIAQLKEIIARRSHEFDAAK